MSYQYGSDVVMVYTNEAFYALVQRVFIVNQDNTNLELTAAEEYEVFLQ